MKMETVHSSETLVITYKSTCMMSLLRKPQSTFFTLKSHVKLDKLCMIMAVTVTVIALETLSFY
jgi:hypothetical protein